MVLAAMMVKTSHRDGRGNTSCGLRDREAWAAITVEKTLCLGGYRQGRVLAPAMRQGEDGQGLRQGGVWRSATRIEVLATTVKKAAAGEEETSSRILGRG